MTRRDATRADRPTSGSVKMEAKLQSLKVPELKELLHGAGLAVTGNKPDLIKRALENPQVLEKVEGYVHDPWLVTC